MISENRLHDILHSVPMNNLEFIPTVFSKDCLLKPKRIRIFFSYFKMAKLTIHYQ